MVLLSGLSLLLVLVLVSVVCVAGFKKIFNICVFLSLSASLSQRFPPSHKRKVPWKFIFRKDLKCKFLLTLEYEDVNPGVSTAEDIVIV